MFTKTTVLSLAVALATLVFAEAADAREVSIAGTVTKSQLKAACAKVGGTYIDSNPGYSCENPEKDTSVVCIEGKCTGYVPKMAPTGGSKVQATPEQILMNEAQ